MSNASNESAARGFWLFPRPLVLASKSEGRRLVLDQTGIPFIMRPAELDERAIEGRIVGEGGGPNEVVLALAREKALAISALEPDQFVVGADQAASCEGRLFGKPENLRKAAEQLRQLSGRVHRLHSAVVLAYDGAILFETVECADLEMRSLREAYISAYLETVGDAALTSAGAYQIEGLGAHLFSAVRGDHWTIMGLPLPPLLEALRRAGALLS